MTAVSPSSPTSPPTRRKSPSVGARTLPAARPKAICRDQDSFSTMPAGIDEHSARLEKLLLGHGGRDDTHIPCKTDKVAVRLETVGAQAGCVWDESEGGRGSACASHQRPKGEDARLGRHSAGRTAGR